MLNVALTAGVGPGVPPVVVVGVSVGVGTSVDVGVAVGIGAGVGVGVGVAVGVGTGVNVGVEVKVGVGVAVGSGPTHPPRVTETINTMKSKWHLTAITPFRKAAICRSRRVKLWSRLRRQLEYSQWAKLESSCC